MLRAQLREEQRRGDALANGLELRAQQARDREAYIEELDREREQLVHESKITELQLSATRAMAKEFEYQRDVAVAIAAKTTGKFMKLNKLRRAVNDLAAIHPIYTINMYKIRDLTASDSEPESDEEIDEGEGDQGPAPDSDSE